MTANVEQMGRKQIRDAGLEVTCVTPDIWASSKWGWGSFAANDPKVRQEAIQEVKKSMEWARQLNCEVVDLWFGQDGYDYPFQADYLGSLGSHHRRHPGMRRVSCRRLSWCSNINPRNRARTVSSPRSVKLCC